MTDIVLRDLRRGDGASVQVVAREAWRHTYKEIFRADFIDQFMATNYSPEALENLVMTLIETGAMFFCVAVVQASIVGFSNIWDRGQGMELLRIYALPAYERALDGSCWPSATNSFVHADEPLFLPRASA
jgi:hypothetical protein